VNRTAHADAAIPLSRSYAHAPPLDVLDLVMQGRVSQVLDLAGNADPGAPFGQLIAASFDPCMAPRERATFTALDAAPSLREVAWRYGVAMSFRDSQLGMQ
jgi:hypothetical protein